MKTILIITSLLLFLSCNAKASVWTATRNWTPADEQAYSNFIATQVEPNFFKDLNLPFSKLKLDCADAAYALRIYFSKINGLPFAVGERAINNATTKFDYIADENRRLSEFIAWAVDNSGTENLSSADSFPVAIMAIQPGDMFLYKIETAPGTFTRHTYLIKNINSNGTFDVMYSTQARRDAGMPMNRLKQYSFPNPKWAPNHTSQDDINQWGFKRFRTPDQIRKSFTQIPNANLEQYNLALQYGDQFFDYVKNARTTVKESPTEALNRMYDFVCHELTDRAEIVAMAIDVRAKTNNACMDPATYDTYSTPSRDGGILGSYNKLFSQAEKYKQTGEWQNIEESLKLKVDGIFNPSRTANVTKVIQSSCGFQKSQGLDTDMARFYEALLRGQVSNHPNDSLLNRWGIITSSTAATTTCPRY